MGSQVARYEHSHAAPGFCREAHDDLTEANQALYNYERLIPFLLFSGFVPYRRIEQWSGIFG